MKKLLLALAALALTACLLHPEPERKPAWRLDLRCETIEWHTDTLPDGSVHTYGTIADSCLRVTPKHPPKCTEVQGEPAPPCPGKR